MSSFVWMIVLTLILTALGTLVLLLITLKYYWGARGTPPATGEKRRQQKEEELIQRAKQIENSQKTRWETRSSNFFDNRKNSSAKK
jgi:hypothetical protein